MTALNLTRFECTIHLLVNIRNNLLWRTDIFCTETREKLSACIIGKCKLSALKLLSIECDVQKRNVHEVIEQFAQMRCRKAKFYNSWTGNTAFFLLIGLVVYISEYTFSLYYIIAYMTSNNA